jgi:hypothetical protein
VALLRSRRLEATFGRSLDSVTAEDIRRLVDNAVAEDFDLDYKRQTYDQGDKGRRDLAIDVAAMANTAGGVILIGVSEDKQARATDAPGVSVSDKEVLRLRQIVASGVAPLPLIDIQIIAKETRPSASESPPTVTPPTGFYLISVPRSPSAPHAAVYDNTLRYPRRNGSSTYYLREAEVATAYADRHRRREDQGTRLTRLEEAALPRLAEGGDSWLILSLSPDLPGDLVIDQVTFQRFQAEMATIPISILPSGPTCTRFGVGRNLLRADNARDGSGAEDVLVELYGDGSGVCALRMNNLLRQTDDNDARQQLIPDEWVSVGTLSGLSILARHARDRAATAGGATLRARLHYSNNTESLEMYTTRGIVKSGESISRYKTLAGETLVGEAVGVIDHMATPGPDLVATAAVLVEDLGHSLSVPEMQQFTRQGQLRASGWRLKGITEWAARNNVEILH